MKKYSALSIVAPGGERIRSGQKTIEVRKWKPKILPLFDLVIVENSTYLSNSGVSQDPNGKAVALVDVLSISEWKQDELEDAYGSYWEEGWLGWKLSNIRPLTYENPVDAKLRIYEIELPEDIEEINKQNQRVDLTR